MAVYTKLSKSQIEDILSAYDCGALLSFEGIVQGVENSNYKILTDKDKFILTVFEQRTNVADLPFFFDYMEHLHDHGIACPFVLKDKGGERIQQIAGKSAALFSFLEGNNIDAADITPQKCWQMGQLLARMHMAAKNFTATRENSMSLSAWKDLFSKIKDKANYSALIEEELQNAEQTLSLDLPKGIVHADAFPDNVFERDDHIYGVIDFYFSATDYFAYDLAITLNAWCFENGEANSAKLEAMLEGYQTIRPLEQGEKDHLFDMLRAAALRILMTRSYDWIFHDPENLVRPKDPLEYKRILEFHRDQVLKG